MAQMAGQLKPYVVGSAMASSATGTSLLGIATPAADVAYVGWRLRCVPPRSPRTMVSRIERIRKAFRLRVCPSSRGLSELC
jgi:hypothetical protein